MPSSTCRSACLNGPPLSDGFQAAGLRNTPARRRVMMALERATHPLSHEQLLEMCKQLDPTPLDRVTVYRTLEAFSRHGLVVKTTDQQGLFRFMAASADAKHREHAHFECLGCGNVRCLNMPTPPPLDLPPGFQLAQARLDFKGFCAHCNPQRP